MGRNLRVPVAELSSGELVLAADASHYLVRVHRAAAGASFVAFDPAERSEALGTLLVADPKAARCHMGELRPSSCLPDFELTLIQGLGKGDKLEQIVRDATALGVTRLVPAECARSVARITEGRARAERLANIAVAAARQSLRGDVPSIERAAPLAEVLARFQNETACRIYLDPNATLPLRQHLALAAASNVVLLVGPEGGFSDAERAAAQAAGFSAASLGRFVLRTETAALAALAVVVGLKS